MLQMGPAIDVFNKIFANIKSRQVMILMTRDTIKKIHLVFLALKITSKYVAKISQIDKRFLIAVAVEANRTISSA